MAAGPATAPTFSGFTAVSPNPGNTPPATFTLSFSEPIYNLQSTFFWLTDNGTGVTFNATQGYPSLATSNNQSWTLTIPSSYMAAYGAYNVGFTLPGGLYPQHLFDAAGNEWSGSYGSLPSTWQMTPWEDFSSAAPVPAYDVNYNGNIEPADALDVIDFLNTHSSDTLSAPTSFATAPPAPYDLYLDVQGTNVVTPEDALLIIDYLNAHPGVIIGGGDTARTAGIQLVAVDMSGNPITSIQVGQQFQIEEFVTDTSASAQGIFAAYDDLKFNSSLASPTGNSSVASGSSVVASASVGVNKLDVGAVFGITPTGSATQLLISETFTATAAGTLSFSTSASNLVGQQILEFGDNSAISPSHVSFGGLNLTVVAPSSTSPGDDESATSPNFIAVAPDSVSAPVPAVSPTVVAIAQSVTPLANNAVSSPAPALTTTASASPAAAGNNVASSTSPTFDATDDAYAEGEDWELDARLARIA